MLTSKIRTSIITAVAVVAVTAVPSVASAQQREVFASPTAKGSSEKVCAGYGELIHRDEELEAANPGSPFHWRESDESKALEAGCIVTDPQEQRTAPTLPKTNQEGPSVVSAKPPAPVKVEEPSTNQNRLSTTTLAIR